MTIVDWTLIFVEYYYDDYWVLLGNAMGVSIRVMPVDGSTLTYVHGSRLIIVVDYYRDCWWLIRRLLSLD